MKVCALKVDNDKECYSALSKIAGEKPETSYQRAKPITGNFCRVDILNEFKSEKMLSSKHLDKSMKELGHKKEY